MSTCLCLAMVAGSCNHDGRELRPARPDQNASISTTAAPSSPTEPGIGGVLGDLTPATVSDVPSSTTGSTLIAPVSVGQSPPGGAVAPWADGGPIGAPYTCTGAGVAPALSWPAAPTATVEIAITMVDEQQPSFQHWNMAGLAADRTSLAQGEIPAGSFQGLNGNGSIGYAGPCPPAGETHTYVIAVHYLSAQVELGNGAAGADLRLAIEAATTATAQVTGTFKSG